MLVFILFAYCFVTLRGTFMHFLELTSRHSASSLFSAVFLFQKSYTANILRIGQNQSQSPRILPKLPENRRGVRVGPRGGHTPGRCSLGPGRAPYV
jgi:hypothetical protein